MIQLSPARVAVAAVALAALWIARGLGLAALLVAGTSAIALRSRRAT